MFVIRHVKLNVICVIPTYLKGTQIDCSGIQFGVVVIVVIVIVDWVVTMTAAAAAAVIMIVMVVVVV